MPRSVLYRSQMSRGPSKTNSKPGVELPEGVFDADSFDPTDSSTWGSTANSIWQYLDQLSKQDPAKYKQFIAQQKQEAKAAGFAGAEGLGSDSEDEAEEQKLSPTPPGDDPSIPDTFTPIPSFVVSTGIIQQPATKPHDPSVAAGVGLALVRPTPSRLFVNVCGSPLMAPPKRKSDHKPITAVSELDAALVAANVLMPLSVGQLFYCEHGIAQSSTVWCANSLIFSFWLCVVRVWCVVQTKPHAMG
jgi:hypothetical protein